MNLVLISEEIFILVLIPSNIKLKSVTLFMFHFEISDNAESDLHSLNIQLISVTLLVVQPEISGIVFNDSHP